MGLGNIIFKRSEIHRCESEMDYLSINGEKCRISGFRRRREKSQGIKEVKVEVEEVEKSGLGQ